MNEATEREYWCGLFNFLEPDPTGEALNTGMMRFEGRHDIHGLVRPSIGKLEFLVLHSLYEGQGNLRKFLNDAKARATEIYVWHVWNPVLAKALQRYGFIEASQTEPDGEVVKGYAWKDV